MEYKRVSERLSLSNDSMIEKVSDISLIKSIWKKIFSSRDPFSFPFQSVVDDFVLFYPTYGYHLEEDQYLSIVETSKSHGETGFYVSIVESAGDFLARGEHWWCEFPKYEDYCKLPLILENAIYSKTSSWGLLISHEDHAIVGGKEKFLKDLKIKYPNYLKDEIELRRYWEGNPNSSWLKELKL